MENQKPNEMKAVRHKPTGRWIGTDENEEYCISDYPGVWVTIESDEEIIDFVTDQFFDEEIEADDIEVKEVVVLTTEELERREKTTAILFCEWVGKACFEAWEPNAVTKKYGILGLPGLFTLVELFDHWQSTRDNSSRGKEDKV